MNFYRRTPVTPTPLSDPMSLQDQIRAVQEMRTAAPSRPRRTGRLVAGASVLALIVGLWQFGPRFGWGSGGKGAGHGGGDQSAPRAVLDGSARLDSSHQPEAPQRPLRVTIEGNRYLVDGKETDIPAITLRATQLPAGEGPAIEVKRDGTSRVKAEQDLKAAVDKEHLPATWSPPLE